jgi:hypothetical protein
MSLKNRISELAEEFSAGVLLALRSASLDELNEGMGVSSARRGSLIAADTGPAKRGRKPGRLARRSDEDLAAVVETIVSCVRKHSDGIRSEDIRKELDIAKNELARPLQLALENGTLRKEGHKRATLYFIKGGGAKTAPKPAKKTTAKPKKKVSAKPKVKAKASSKSGGKKKAAAPKKTKKTLNGAAPHAETSSGDESSAEATE